VRRILIGFKVPSDYSQVHYFSEVSNWDDKSLSETIERLIVVEGYWKLKVCTLESEFTRQPVQTFYGTDLYGQPIGVGSEE
jgi:hypothetical protein